MLRYLLFTLLIISNILISCNSAELQAPLKDKSVESDIPVRLPQASVESDLDKGSASPIGRTSVHRKLIRHVNLYLVVLDTEKTFKEIQNLVISLNGYVASVNAYRIEEFIHYDFVLRIPAEQLDLGVDAIKQMALRIERENMETEDVTDQYIDLEARLKTLNATEKELQMLLEESRQQNHDVKNIMEIYRELTEIRARIEQIQGKLNLLDQQVGFSTVSVTLRPDESTRPVVEKGWYPSETVRNSARILLNVLRTSGDLLIFSIIVLIPSGVMLAIPVFVVIFLVKKLRRRRRRKRFK